MLQCLTDNAEKQQHHHRGALSCESTEEAGHQKLLIPNLALFFPSPFLPVLYSLFCNQQTLQEDSLLPFGVQACSTCQIDSALYVHFSDFSVLCASGVGCGPSTSLVSVSFKNPPSLAAASSHHFKPSTAVYLK
jgi:hypothetical protein